jgi:hypothetical protein
MIQAAKDTMVYPNAGEWWGQFAPGQFKTIQTMKETDLFKNNLFGLQTVATAGKVTFNQTAGQHLQFTVEQVFACLLFDCCLLAVCLLFACLLFVLACCLLAVCLLFACCLLLITTTKQPG